MDKVEQNQYKNLYKYRYSVCNNTSFYSLLFTLTPRTPWFDTGNVVVAVVQQLASISIPIVRLT